jgi:DNA-binding PadR family transcriptional regulator
MTKKSALQEVGTVKNQGVAYFILSSLADGEKHGYALTKDIEEFSRVRISPGTLYEALARLEKQGLIEPVATVDRRRPYRLTAAGAMALNAYVREQERFIQVSRTRLRRNWRMA